MKNDSTQGNLEKGTQNHLAVDSNSTEYDPQSISPKHNYSNEQVQSNPILRITTSNNGDIIYLGDQAFNKRDLQNAFAGDLNPGLHTLPARPMGNPVPLGLSAFSVCCFVVSLINCNARSVTNAEVIASSALFFGGVIEAIAGFWCLIIENTFAATALGSFGGFWMGYWALLADAWGVRSSYQTEAEYGNAVGFYLSAWVIFAFLMWLCTFKATWPFFSLFLLLWVFIMLLAIGNFSGSASVTKAGGVTGLIASFIGFYIVYAGTATPANSYIIPRPLPMPFSEVV
ncbi:hypothetical protein WICMUC_005045 [Wickerhamomyces mucosus]|uniref:Uncharacterized protein n=1 Tax=Wickerhamomyces mucosus TaxID=1378264 RepID=A0A9P8PCD5_9ASCO|nr:hypothetical protein WICMUC_005045 [Wickerhamomyces mucosus]